MEVDPFDCHIEPLGLEFLFDSKDFTERVSLFGVSHFKGEGHQFDLGFLDVLREAGGRAIDTDLDLSAQGHPLGFLQFIEDSSSDVFNEALKLDGMTFLTEVGAAFIAGVRREEGAIGRGDLISGFPKVSRCLRDGVWKGSGGDLRDRG